MLPLSLCGGAYCVQFTIDKQPFRAIVDTGSPFLLVDGTPGPSPWGTYRGSGGDSGLEDTDEKFGGQDVGVQWRTGDVVLGDGAIAVPKATFGVVRAYVGKGGDGAVFLGLAKRRLPRIRPTLLEQTQVAALPCLTSQGEGVARTGSAARENNDVRSFHPGQRGAGACSVLHEAAATSRQHPRQPAHALAPGQPTRPRAQ